MLETMVLCRRQRDARQGSAAREGAPKSTPTPLSEMSDAEAARIEIPDSFLPVFESEPRAVPTARGLLDNALLRGLPRPWFAKRE